MSVNLHTVPQAATSYSIGLHQHRFALWVAARASSLPLKGPTVKVVVEILEAAGLQECLCGADLLPPPELTDQWFREKREIVIVEAQKKGHVFSHGRAGKALTMYLKALYHNPATCIHAHVAALHPPIDSTMIDGIITAKVGNTKLWRQARIVRWSNLDSSLYEALIADLRVILGDAPLWHAEQFWPGYR